MSITITITIINNITIAGPRATKKGGGGGKYTWGSELQPVDVDDEVVDRDDPSYVSDEDDRLVQQSRAQLIREYKQSVCIVVVSWLKVYIVGNCV